MLNSKATSKDVLIILQDFLHDGAPPPPINTQQVERRNSSGRSPDRLNMLLLIGHCTSCDVCLIPRLRGRSNGPNVPARTNRWFPGSPCLMTYSPCWYVRSYMHSTMSLICCSSSLFRYWFLFRASVSSFFTLFTGNDRGPVRNGTSAGTDCNGRVTGRPFCNLVYVFFISEETRETNRESEESLNTSLIVLYL